MYGNPGACLNAPVREGRGGLRTGGLEGAGHLVTQGQGERPGVGGSCRVVKIAPADARGPDPEEGILGARLGHRDIPVHQGCADGVELNGVHITEYHTERRKTEVESTTLCLTESNRQSITDPQVDVPGHPNLCSGPTHACWRANRQERSGALEPHRVPRW